MFCDEWLLCPMADDPKFSEWLVDAVSIFQIDIIMSGVEHVLEKVAALRQNITPCSVLAHSVELTQIFNNKWQTAQWFHTRNLAHPSSYLIDGQTMGSDLVERLGLPMIVKPVDGRGSSEVSLLTNIEDISPDWYHSGNMLAQQYVGTESSEYTCAVYKSPLGYTRILIQKRYLKGGSTCYSEVIEHQGIRDYCGMIAAQINEPGAFNIQLRLSDQGEPVCFEINLRLSGTAYMRHEFGFRDCLAWVAETLTNSSQLELFEPSGKVIGLRYETEIFLTVEEKEKLQSITPLGTS